MQQIEARVCQCGCGRKLLTKTGEPDMKRRHFDQSCRNRDKRIKKRLKDAETRQKKLKAELRLLKRVPRPCWVIVGNTPIGLATANAAIELAKSFPEILGQLNTVPIGKLLRALKCSVSKLSGASSPPPISPAPKTRAAKGSSGQR